MATNIGNYCPLECVLCGCAEAECHLIGEVYFSLCRDPLCQRIGLIVSQEATERHPNRDPFQDLLVFAFMDIAKCVLAASKALARPGFPQPCPSESLRRQHLIIIRRIGEEPDQPTIIDGK